MRGLVAALLTFGLCVVLAACGLTGGAEPQSTPSKKAKEKKTPTPISAVDYAQVGKNEHAAELGGRSYSDTGEGVLVGPHFVLKQQSTGVVQEIGAGLARRLGLGRPVRAASGYELVIADFASSVDYHQQVVEGGHEPGSLRGTSDDKKFTQMVLVGEKGERKPSSTVAAGSLLVVSAKVDEPVRLKVVDSGRSQLLDLRTGKRAKDSLSGYYPNEDWTPPTPPDSFGTGWSSKGEVSTGDVGDVEAELTELDVELSPFAPNGTWSRSGRAWLYVTTQVSTPCFEPYLCQVHASPTVRPDKGEPVKGKPFWSTPDENPSADAGRSTQAFEVSSSVKAATVQVMLDGRVSVHKLAGEKKSKVSGAKWAKKPPPLVVRAKPVES